MLEGLKAERSADFHGHGQPSFKSPRPRPDDPSMTLQHQLEVPRVLIADDDRDLAQIYAANLRKDGFRVEIVNSGQDALDRLDDVVKPPVSAMVLDLRMPGLDGRDVLSRLKKGGHSSMPVLVVTSVTDDYTRHTVAELGARDMLVKPVFGHELANRVRRMLMM